MDGLPVVGETMRGFVEAGYPLPTYQVTHCGFFSEGHLMFITQEPNPEAIDIFKRFTKVFDQTYTRFLDLKKAEAQARESEIQLTLERVRAKSMAMHQSDELADLSLELVKQVHALGIDTWFCAFNIYDDHPEGSIEWGSNGQGTFPQYRTPREGIFLDYYEAGQKGETFLVNEIGEEECPAHYDYLCSLPGVGDQLLKMKDEGIPFPTSQIDHVAYFKYGYIIFITFEPAPEAYDIFKRFAKVFQQTYTRFLDLQKSEEQAREAKIEAALERVRARSMGMHKSDDLIDVVREIGKGIHELGIQLHHSQIYTDYTYDPKTDVNIWVDVEGQDYLEKFHLPYIDHTITLNFYNALNEGLDYFSDRYSKAEKDSYFKLLFKYSDLKRIPKKRKELILNASGWTRFTVILNEAALNFGRYSLDEFKDEEHEIFIRFAKVFGQAYTRFLDLQKAEEQAKEAQVEAALERVRAQAMAMHHTEDLGKTIEVYFEQLDSLIDSIIVRCGAGLLNKENRIAEMSTASRSADGEVYSVNGVIDMRGHPLLDSTYEHWLMQKEHSYVLRGNEIREYYQYITNQVAVPENAGTDELHFHFPMFTEGSFYVVAERELPDDELNIFRRFSSVLSLTYRRFNDLKKAEAQAREARIETALEKIRSRTMAMQKGEELQEVAVLLYKELIALGVINFVTCGYVEVNEDIQKQYTWITAPGGDTMGLFHIPLTGDDTFDERYAAWKKQQPVFHQTVAGQVRSDHLEYAITTFNSKEAEEMVRSQFPDPTVFYCFNFPHGYLHIVSGSRLEKEEEELLARFTKVFEQTYTRFLDLQSAEEQAREAQISAALERVRARSMGMQKSEELIKVVRQIGQELKEIGIDVHYSQIWTDFTTDPHDGVNIWVDVQGQSYLEKFHIPYEDQLIYRKFFKALDKDLDFFSDVYSKQEKDQYFKFLLEESDLKRIPQERKDFILNAPGWVRSTVILNNSCLHFGRFNLDEFTEEEEMLFQRFGKVFGQAYTRFLDLQKAEAQAREAKIETALEKVRSRTMGMQSSEELPEVANMLFLEVQELGIPAWSCGYCILTEDRRSSTCIMSSEGTVQKPFLLPHTGEASFLEWDDFVQSDQTLFTQELGGDAIENHYNYMKSLPQMTPVFKDLEEAGLTLPDYQINHLCKFAHGFLLFITYEPVPDAHDIFKRFTRVFDQTYTRFLDLKKAEKQAREAQIENALEKVRSRSLAMQSSDELSEVVRVMYGEVEKLEISNWGCTLMIFDNKNKNIQLWFSEIVNNQHARPYDFDNLNHDLVRKWREFWESENEFMSIHLKDEENDQWTNYLFENTGMKDLPKEVKEVIRSENEVYFEYANMKHGLVSFINLEPFSEDIFPILKRITRTFEQAYTRFLDVQIAEENARRARQQASLDRVRADISSMRSADDLNRVIPLIWSELTTLGIPFIRCGVFIIHEEKKEVEVYLSKPDGTSLAVMHLPFNSSKLANKTVEAWKKGSVYTQHWTREEFLDWGRSMVEQGQVSDLESYQGAEEAPESLHLHFIPFNQGLLYVGSIAPFNDEEINLSESLVKTFSIAYARYEDFVKLEKAKAGIEDALTELKATQSQLVQQEKLASLGQLTAGIAHEIKNPLNFVNNFSELSVELVEETKEELSAISGQLSAEDKVRVDEALEILKDIDMNLRKIHEHGSRADSIVKSMLEHSRGGSGKMEPTELNGLVKEFVNLTFHGMRASKNPINVDMEFELDDSIGGVPLIAEDFSRVLVNLCNNAFDAMREKEIQNEKLKIENYSPKLSIRTQKTDSGISIEIEDNGPGIPEDMKDKILQPFFTTKKGTAGTGLGLSITNDIVKAHGGGIEIKSFPGEGSIFTIQLPKSGL